ncbi:GNAT family N-acetyltransferase [Ketogulonicigenium vulgare]|uniref:Acetyltransferase, gnat family protein n=1 Tax=Ketogulonicigenium vulgare (strain WSH-001) TaxID=759362 RepID=F9Y7L4_KETVW|nr:GNAT family N-acetyltransferase [Ketogulonicigenium vulgare]ADO41451.1 GCN5-related N-acetyltransferase [Ketogulonicigenium vulgare Y25]AEM42310.1 Acetyltransferase, gnat family protein [Ketogulonicigenium vulgare WSH-001]ALJ79931.1 GNAT family acetyltransferase [Ketogulonicigenium vulgare]ANW32825.1 GNAT family acetyltransferase [Ketogulonicigenium vulgare]AOZ53386.1 GCN5-related N-acetyltransferase [Ketogulonicigenium vulgare]
MDMLVNLFSPRIDALGLRAAKALDGSAITIRRAIPPELHILQDWTRAHFSPYWVSEVTVAMAHQPPGCLIATEGGSLLGFACYDATARGFFGPTGVAETQRGRGIGLALLHQTLVAMKSQGHAYAIIGAVGPVDFYAEAVGAMPIPTDSGDIYQGLLRAPAAFKDPGQ